jgi:glycosyltransferase involved in cell wall biosynthesis
MMTASPQWICCQLGAREHYAIPRALFHQRALEHLVTDAWGAPVSLVAILGGGRKSDIRHGESVFPFTPGYDVTSWRISGRWHQELRDAPVRAFTSSLLMFELLARARAISGWPKIVARNEWFQRKVVSFLRSQLPTINYQPILLSYSYAALEPLRFARSQGWRTVLGQIDPGPLEEEILAAEAEKEASLAPHWKRAPAGYWKSWREECDVADQIIVNSQWSFDALVGTGIGKEKLSIIPLAYEPTSEARSFHRTYPDQFTDARPLRVLFLGQVNLRKGVARLLNAIRLLKDEPIEFQFVGPVQISVPDDLTNNPRVRWFGAVSRGEVDTFYRDADVLIFPTLSDGFGLTQLEAQAWSLPVIASRFCGEVVADRQNGLRLQEVCPAAIAEALRYCVHRPEHLRAWSENSVKPEKFGLNTLAGQLMSLSEATS